MSRKASAVEAVSQATAARLEDVEAERRPDVLRPTSGKRSRAIKVTDKDGKVVAIRGHEDLIQGLLVRQGLEIEVQKGRPKQVMCAVCHVVVVVIRKIPRFCKACRQKTAGSRNIERRLANPEKERERKRNSKRKHQKKESLRAKLKYAALSDAERRIYIARQTARRQKKKAEAKA